jgi:hypothetical protein
MTRFTHIVCAAVWLVVGIADTGCSDSTGERGDPTPVPTGAGVDGGSPLDPPDAGSPTSPPDVLAEVDGGDVAPPDAGPAVGEAADGGGGDLVDPHGKTIDWSSCGVLGSLPDVPAEEFCRVYVTTRCPMTAVAFVDQAACLARYSSYNVDQRNCAAYMLCRAQSVTDFCPHSIAPAGPCNLP